MIQDIHQQYCWHISEEYQFVLANMFSPVCHPSSGCQSVLPSMNKSASADGGTGKIGDGLIFPFRYWTMDQRVGRYTIHQAHNLGHQHTYHMPSPFSGSKFHPQTWPLGCATSNHLSNHETPRSGRDTPGPKFGIKVLSQNPFNKKTSWWQTPRNSTIQRIWIWSCNSKAVRISPKRNLASVVVASEANPRLLARLNRKRTSWCCRLQDPQDHPREIWRKQKHGEMRFRNVKK